MELEDGATIGIDHTAAETETGIGTGVGDDGTAAGMTGVGGAGDMMMVEGEGMIEGNGGTNDRMREVGGMTGDGEGRGGEDRYNVNNLRAINPQG